MKRDNKNIKKVTGRCPKFTRAAANFDQVRSGIPTGVWVLGAPLLWSQNFDGAGVIVGVIDTGIDDSHPDLHANFVKRVDFIGDGAAPKNFHPHGTHVAGTIAANGSIKGVAPKAKLIDYRIFDTEGNTTETALEEAIEQSIQDGCHIINLSLGGPATSPNEEAVIKKAVAAGMFVVVAAGNEGEELPSPQISWPANYPEVVCVGAVNFNSKNGNLEIANFSNETPQMDVAADGVDVLSTIPGGRYEEFSGTSMATPHVAGFSALLLQKTLKLDNTNLQRPQYGKALWATLKDNTVDVLTQGFDQRTGAGFVTLYPAIPKRDSKGKWFIPGMSTGEPII